MSRLTPLDPADYDDAQRVVAEALSAGPRGSVRGPFRLLMHNPELAARLAETGNVVRWGLSLPPALSEVAILAVAAHFSAATIVASHEAIARTAGVPDATVAAIASGGDDIGDPGHAAVLRFTRELLDGGQVSDTTLAEVATLAGEKGVVELIALVGYYHISCMLVAVAQLSEEEWRG